MNAAVNRAVARWTNPETRPLFKGSLIDKATGCMCAQGDVLFNEGGYSADDLKNMQQNRADTLTMDLLGISRAHSILLRHVNDSNAGQPQNVLTDPGSVLGVHYGQVLSFWLRMDSLTAADWVAVRKARYDAAYDAASAAYDAAYDAASAGRYATLEIIGQRVLAERGKPFVFLPMFGFDTPDAIPARYDASPDMSLGHRNAKPWDHIRVAGDDGQLLITFAPIEDIAK